ncbi:TetR/AcrR family transcriptional regulator [Methanobrevibacter sp. TMH8]|uniref:TetR/AcrR family transcriptional regulator n=1 Tax=Methanobrevibacter sp. TMH8 TaxID=2848611 RepID=UPI001CCA65ED|nr:TetR/AcrR family transcriptional regulator [Methanobrevibacter sp. TMH8]MBZ9570262.1 TetR/AcrR family transcriptional regulator [Methanobrevibacter sp. TMH8]
MNVNNTKEKIFSVAIDLFSKKGYNDVSMREIAREVGIKEASIYYHYSKKEDILESIFTYFMENMNKITITKEDEEKFLSQSPMMLYHYGSEGVKSQFKSVEMIKILRLMFIELYHNDKIKEFFLKELVYGIIDFWTLLFQNLMDKKIIRKADPKKLAESYYNYSMFKMFETVVIKYPNNPSELDLDTIFNDIEDHFKFILNYMSIDKSKNNSNNSNNEPKNI